MSSRKRPREEEESGNGAGGKRSRTEEDEEVEEVDPPTKIEIGMLSDAPVLREGLPIWNPPLSFKMPAAPDTEPAQPPRAPCPRVVEPADLGIASVRDEKVASGSDEDLFRLGGDSSIDFSDDAVCYVFSSDLTVVSSNGGRYHFRRSVLKEGGSQVFAVAFDGEAAGIKTEIKVDAPGGAVNALLNCYAIRDPTARADWVTKIMVDMNGRRLTTQTSSGKLEDTRAQVWLMDLGSIASRYDDQKIVDICRICLIAHMCPTDSLMDYFERTRSWSTEYIKEYFNRLTLAHIIPPHALLVKRLEYAGVSLEGREFLNFVVSTVPHLVIGAGNTIPGTVMDKCAQKIASMKRKDGLDILGQAMLYDNQPTRLFWADVSMRLVLAQVFVAARVPGSGRNDYSIFDAAFSVASDRTSRPKTPLPDRAFLNMAIAGRRA
jgi:hypothetical protein